MALWLRHITASTTYSQRYEELSKDSRASVTRKIGETLRGNTYDHRLAKRRKFTITISADETYGATSAKRDFLNAYFEGDARFINLSEAETEPSTGWIAVALEGGDTPFQNVEDCDLMPEFTFVLIEKEAS